MRSATDSHRQRLAMAAIALVLTVLTAACDNPASLPRAANRGKCPTEGAFARDATYVLQCKSNHRWTRVITIENAQRAVAALNIMQSPASTTVPPWISAGSCFGGSGNGADIRYLGPDDTIGNYAHFVGGSAYGSCGGTVVVAPSAIVRAADDAVAGTKCRSLRGPQSVPLNMVGMGWAGMPGDAWGCS